MGIKAEQVRELIIRPTLKQIDLWSAEAENLLMGTSAHETHLGSYIKQINGPALGIYQMEPATFCDVVEHVVERARLKSVYLRGYSFDRDPEDMIWDSKLATIMCRLQYWRFDEALPNYNNVRGLADYWKKYYNTTSGKGRPQDFIHNYTLTGR